MNRLPDLAFSISQRGLLYAASLIVPASARKEWEREWLGELWHVRRSSLCSDEGFSLDGQREVTRFCLGAFPDAICFRGMSVQPSAPAAHVHGSAGQTLLWLAAAASLCCVIASLLPGVQAEREASHFRVNSNVLLISDAAASGTRPSISTGQFREWKMARQRFFDSLAFYRVARERAENDAVTMHWKVAHSTKNLFSLLGLPISFASVDMGDSQIPALILSRRTWFRDFAGDTRVIGHAFNVGNVRARIAGVAPSGSWQLPGEPDAWLLEPDHALTSEAMTSQNGFLFAALSERGMTEWEGRGISIEARDGLDNSVDLYGVPISAPIAGQRTIFKFAIFLALLALPAVVSVSLGEGQLSSHRPSMRQRLSRTFFLIAKFGLIAAVGFYGSLDTAYCISPEYSPVAECVQLLSCFAICLLGFRWAVADQRQRCPMCLRRVTNPATVGLASRTFLGWNGTEMICMGGHALLHVPSLPTSWFGGQRWLYLDSSWEFLFAESRFTSMY